MDPIVNEYNADGFKPRLEIDLHPSEEGGGLRRNVPALMPAS
jgi:hypothetical protein